jgi:hypothetical protein
MPNLLRALQIQAEKIKQLQARTWDLEVRNAKLFNDNIRLSKQIKLLLNSNKELKKKLDIV